MSSECIDHGLTGNKPGGYHQIRVQGRLQYVHRLVFQEANNLFAPDMPPLVRHLCHNPRCVNPNHLAAGTHQDNADDRVAANRSAMRQPNRLVLAEETENEIQRRYKLHKAHGVKQMTEDYKVPAWVIYPAIHRKYQ